jgi:hypothetical protein
LQIIHNLAKCLALQRRNVPFPEAELFEAKEVLSQDRIKKEIRSN